MARGCYHAPAPGLRGGAPLPGPQRLLPDLPAAEGRRVRNEPGPEAILPAAGLADSAAVLRGPARFHLVAGGRRWPADLPAPVVWRRDGGDSRAGDLPPADG